MIFYCIRHVFNISGRVDCGKSMRVSDSRRSDLGDLVALNEDLPMVDI